MYHVEGIDSDFLLGPPCVIQIEGWSKGVVVDLF